MTIASCSTEQRCIIRVNYTVLSARQGSVVYCTVSIFSNPAVRGSFSNEPWAYCVTTSIVYVPAARAGVTIMTSDGLLVTISVASTTVLDCVVVSTKYTPLATSSPAIFILLPLILRFLFGVSKSFTEPLFTSVT